MVVSIPSPPPKAFGAARHAARAPRLAPESFRGCRPAPFYRPRRPRASPLFQLLERHFAEFERVYPERFAVSYGYWRPIVSGTVAKFLRCGDLHEGFARVKCRACKHEFFVAFSCKQRCVCPSCHQKRSLILSERLAAEVCAPVAHPERFRGCASSSASTARCSATWRGWRGKRCARFIAPRSAATISSRARSPASRPSAS